MSLSGTDLSRRSVLAAGATSGAVLVLGTPGSAEARAASATQVLDAKRRLAAQGYYPGPAGPELTPLTTCAVLAYQKANRMAADGLLDLQVMTALKTPRTPVRFTSSGPAIEVDLARQLLRVVRNGTVLATLHATTGDGQVRRVRQRKIYDRTPEGRFRLKAGTEPGNRTDELGVQFRPHDFYTGGYAIYGRDDLAGIRKAVTHGGVAVHSSALLWLEDKGYLAAGTLVVVD